MSAGENTPDLWRHLLPRPAADGHKYDRGHAVILAAPALTGATRLAAEACSRMGTGLVSVLATERGDVYRASLPSDIMVSEGHIADIRKPTVLLAGCGGVAGAHEAVLHGPPDDVVMVLDAEAIGKGLPAPSDQPAILTPHEGEFARFFPDIEGDKLDRARAAAERTNAIVVLKGAETVITAADGRAVVNRHASPWLAKAGTGDVLAGMIAGLAAQDMPPFDAACAGVWIHGEAGRRIGPGLVAGDIASEVPGILARLLNE
ncbi:MAG: NAD(P)H-hydrate dehydratase [Pacificimonas sp.]